MGTCCIAGIAILIFNVQSPNAAFARPTHLVIQNMYSNTAQIKL